MKDPLDKLCEADFISYLKDHPKWQVRDGSKHTYVFGKGLPVKLKRSYTTKDDKWLLLVNIALTERRSTKDVLEDVVEQSKQDDKDLQRQDSLKVEMLKKNQKYLKRQMQQLDTRRRIDEAMLFICFALSSFSATIVLLKVLGG